MSVPQTFFWQRLHSLHSYRIEAFSTRRPQATPDCLLIPLTCDLLGVARQQKWPMLGAALNALAVPGGTERSLGRFKSLKDLCALCSIPLDGAVANRFGSMIRPERIPHGSGTLRH